MSLISRFLKVVESYVSTDLLQNPFKEHAGEDSRKDPRNDSYEEPREESNEEPRTNTGKSSQPPQALYEDLALFELTLPTTLDILTKKRNALLRAYHPDKFETNPEKKQVANEMIQLINGAHERIATYLKTL